MQMAENESVPLTKQPQAPPRPTISLPPRGPMESLFAGGFGASPGPMTLVSSFFSDNDPESEYRSFSELLAGAMASPAAAAQRPGFFPADDISWKVDGGGGNDGGGAGKGEFRFQQNRPAGLLVTQPQLFTIPPGLSPATLLDSPSLFPGQGPFEMSHQQALAHVTAQAAQAHAFPSLLAVVPPTSLAQSSSFTSETSMQQNVLPSATNITKESTQLCDSDQRIQPSTITVDKPADDGYNWRKYGQKQVKGGEFPRSYYKCTHLGCSVKKQVERSLDGRVIEIVYRGQHNHSQPQPNKRSREAGNTNGNSSIQGNPEPSLQGRSGNVNRLSDGEGILQSRKDEESSQATSEHLSSDDEEEKNDVNGVYDGDEGEPQSKKRNTEVQVEQAASQRTVTEPKIIVQTTSEVDLLDDGYRWRKYGQKVVKGNPYPRSYYRCTYPGCNVRKHVERASTDLKEVVTTYEGKHNHDVPVGKSSSSSHNNVSTNVPQLRPHNQIATDNAFIGKTDFVNGNQQPVALLRLKEERIT